MEQLKLQVQVRFFLLKFILDEVRDQGQVFSFFEIFPLLMPLQCSLLGKKEISVLELLELQARARAIRSQLALEPVTKIELDSDNDSVNSSSSKVLQNAASSVAAAAGNNKEQTNKEKVTVEATNGMQIIKPNVPKVKPVRLKRNFRQRQNEDYDPDEDDETKSIENCESKEVEQKSMDESDDRPSPTSPPTTVQLNEDKRTDVERSPSPDLIPIVQEPETYCISSDSDGGSSSVPKYINYPTVVKENLPETEDEKFLKKIKEGSGADLRDLIKSRRGGKHVDDSGDKNETTKATSNVAVPNSTETCNRQDDNLATTSNLENLNEEVSVPQSDQQVDKDTEPEEGELTDGDDADEITILSSDDEMDGKQSTDNKCNDATVTQVDHDGSKNIEDESSTESCSTSDNDSDSDSSVERKFKEADDDDDIIDLGKDEELDFEMKEAEQIESKRKKLKKTKKKVKAVVQSKESSTVNNTEDLKTNETKDNESVDEQVDVTESTDKVDALKEKESVETGAEAAADTSEVMDGSFFLDKIVLIRGSQFNFLLG